MDRVRKARGTLLRSLLSAGPGAGATSHGEGGQTALTRASTRECDAILFNRLRNEFTALPKRIGELLIERGKLDPANLERALKLQEGESREKIGVILLRLGMVSGRDLADALADQLDLPLAMATDFPELPLLEERLSSKFLRDAQAVPLREDDDELALAIADPTDSFVVSAVQMAAGKRVKAYIAAPNEIEAALERLYGGGKSSMGAIVEGIQSRDEEQDWGDVEHLKDLASEAPVIRLVNLLFTKALEQRASDIHIEPFENRLVVRYRIDGVLHEVESPPRRLSAAVISRVKIMASLDIAERRLPQDGRIKLRVQGKEIDLRVSTRAHDARRKRRDADPRQGRRAARLQVAGIRRQAPRALHRRAGRGARHPARDGPHG